MSNNNEPKISFHHQPDGKKSIGKRISELAETAEKIWIASAFLTKGGLDLLDSVSKKCDEIKIICGKNEYISDLSALNNYVKKSEKRKGWVYTGKEPLFHPKLYVFFHKKSVAVIMGSANFTGQGLNENNEISVKFDFQETNGEFIKISDYFVLIKDNSIAVEKFLEKNPDYDEKRKNNKKNMKIFHDQEISEYEFDGKIVPCFLWQKSGAGFKVIQVNKDKKYIKPEEYFSNQQLPIKNMRIVTEKVKEGIKCTIGKEMSNNKPLYKIRVPRGLKNYPTEFMKNEPVRYTINLSEKTIHISKVKK